MTSTGEQKGVFIKKTFTSPNGGDIPYQFLIPEISNEDQKYPLLVFLHGGGELGSDNASQLVNFPIKLIGGYNKLDYPAFVIAPQCPASDSWSSFPEYPSSRASVEPTQATRLVIELIESLLAEYNIDPSRVYVTGMSLGGEGTFDIVSRRPDLFAAAVPICGIADVERAADVKDVAFWIFHGEKDDINLVTYSKAMVEALQAVGASPKYTEYAGEGHNVWVHAYSEPDLFPWLFSQHKK
jgi:predicted peptidase